MFPMFLQRINNDSGNKSSVATPSVNVNKLRLEERSESPKAKRNKIHDKTIYLLTKTSRLLRRASNKKQMFYE